jgi:hypothetical protein
VRLDGAESCVSTQALAHDVENALHRKVFVSAADADLSVEGHVSRTRGPDVWRAVVSVRDKKGTLLGVRELESHDESCAPLGEQIAFVVSVLIESEAPAPPEQPPAREVVVQRETVYVPVETRARPEWRFAAELGASTALGLLPRAAFGVMATALVLPPRFWTIAVTGTYLFDLAVEAERGAHADVSLAYGSLALCPFSSLDRPLVYRVCLGANLGSLRFRGVGFDRAISDESVAVHVASFGEFGVRVVGPLLAVAGVSLLVPLTKSELFYTAQDGSRRQLFRGAPVAAAGSLGLAVIFP